MEEAPRTPIQTLAGKLELLSGKQIEKHFPGLKAEFDQALDERIPDGDEQAFWARIAELFTRYGVTGEAVARALEER